MFRFFILQTVFLFSLNLFAQEYSFTQKHITPVLKRGSDRVSLLTFVGGAFAVGLSNPSDDSVRADWKNNQKMDKSTARVGDLLGTGGVAVLSSGFQYLFDDREYVYQSHLRGLAYGGVAIYVLKTAFGRPRPGNSDNHQSFPSGHTTITFMTATHLTYAYGWKAAVIAFPVAIFTGASRLADDVHWFSDILGGAFLGFIVGRATYYDEASLSEINVSEVSHKVQTQIIPIVTHDSLGAAAFVSF